ncbi:hypothetical protein Taro_011037 [Colocasia esculenta]|uniref:non-specific serine/threonine protein kinase n=1 Tax=Colocasia esculenta TaxID=4460 RepID=A0A843U956_COLES|nr:hypothetical protein [Colocasia esculenta]
MPLRVLLWCLLLRLAASSDGVDHFVFNGFHGAELRLDGTATITSEGLLRLTNTTKLLMSHAFFPTPIRFRSSPAGSISSFSSTFVFGIVPEFADLSGHGIAFFMSPSEDIPGAIGSQYLGLFSPSNNGNSSNHIFAVELDTIQNPEFADINANHVGIDINSMRSYRSLPAGYRPRHGGGGFRNLTLISGHRMQVWVEFDGTQMQVNVTLAPLGEPKPSIPLLSAITNLSDVFFESMYVGFSSSSDPFLTSHYIVGWSFKMNGEAPALNLSSLPLLPTRPAAKQSKNLATWVPASLSAILLITVAGIVLLVRRRIQLSEVIEDWELEYGPSRFSYKDLFMATKGFSDKEVLGAGGFGKVYRGVLPKSENVEIAVKRISHDSRQGVKEFVAEIVSIGRLRHRNLVQLRGYCRRKGELLLVYDFMANGSLDKLLFDQNTPKLDWNQRFRIIKGVASGLLYLHEEWEQVVVHRDIKASNVLLDDELNGRLGDFGLARLYDHGGAPQTTHVVGTMGYLAPELAKGGKANKATDVFAFGVFLLEVACGRRPIDAQAAEEEAVLVDWVLSCWSRGAILEAADSKLGDVYATEVVELVLRLGLLCCDPVPTVRPSMRQVLQFLEGDVPLPEFTSNYLNGTVMSLLQNEAWDTNMLSCPGGSTTASVLSEGR